MISCYMDISISYDDTDDHSSDDKSVLSNISSVGRVLVDKTYVKIWHPCRKLEVNTVGGVFQ
jgi:hypothetical protein